MIRALARQIIELDKGEDVEAQATLLQSHLKQLSIPDIFLQGMISSASQILHEKTDALADLTGALVSSQAYAQEPAFVCAFRGSRAHRIEQGPAQTTDDFSLPTVDDFVVCKTLSRGSFGEVYLARKKSTREYYALKVRALPARQACFLFTARALQVLKKRDLIRKNQLSHVMNERRMMAMINSPYVVKLYYSFQTVDSLYMVLEYANGGTLAPSLPFISAAWMLTLRFKAMFTCFCGRSARSPSRGRASTRPKWCLRSSTSTRSGSCTATSSRIIC